MGDSSKVFTDVMIDVETTGLDPCNAAIIQIGAVPFNYYTREVDSTNMYKRSLTMPRSRFWTSNTQQFWMVDNRELYFKIMDSAQNYREVIHDFHRWSMELGDNVRWWSKGFFDWAIVESYFSMENLDMPYNFRQAKDMRSFIAGLNGTPVFDDPQVEKVGNYHDALSDSLTQLRQLFTSIEHTCQTQVISN